MMMTITEIRRILDGNRESVMCNYDESDPSTHWVRLSLDQAESISKSLARIERLWAVLMGGAE